MSAGLLGSDMRYTTIVIAMTAAAGMSAVSTESAQAATRRTPNAAPILPAALLGTMSMMMVSRSAGTSV